MNLIKNIYYFNQIIGSYLSIYANYTSYQILLIDQSHTLLDIILVAYTGQAIQYL